MLNEATYATLAPLYAKSVEAEERWAEARMHERSRRTSGLKAASVKANRRVYEMVRSMGYVSDAQTVAVYQELHSRYLRERGL